MRRSILVMALVLAPLTGWAQTPTPAPEAAVVAPTPAPVVPAAVAPVPVVVPAVEPPAAPVAIPDVPAVPVATPETPVVPAVVVPDQIPVTDAPPPVAGLLEAIQHGNWSIAIGLALGLGLWFLRKFNLLWINKVPVDYVGWVAACLGMLGYIAAALTAGVAWQTAVAQGFATGAEAVGLWELVLKKLLPKPVAPVASDLPAV